MLHTLKQIYSSLDFIGLLFFGLIIVEALYNIVIKKKSYKDSLANFLIFIVNTLLERLIYGIIIYFGLLFIQQFAFYQIPNTWLSFLLVIIFSDFIYYWVHRWGHEIRLFWTTHSIHHSSEEFNLTTSLRTSWLSSIYEWIFYTPLVLVGFSFEILIIAISLNQIYGIWTHSEQIKKLGVFEYIFVTPSSHRVHHGSNSQYLDKNYGGIFIIWDKLFGTFEPEAEKIKYGLTTPINTYNPFKINFIEIKHMIQDFKAAKNTKDAWRYVFGRTGWKQKNNS